MTIHAIRGFLPISYDLGAELAPNGTLLNLVNGRLKGGYIEPFLGDEDRYNITITGGTATVTQSLAVSPYFFMPVEYSDTHYVAYCSNTMIYGANWTSNRTDLTRTSGGADVSYSGTVDTRWTGVVHGGLPYLTNGVDVLQVQATPGLSARFQNARWDSSANTTWATRTAGAVSCQCIRAFGAYTVALDTTENSVRYPRRVRWGHPVVTGTQTVSWEDTRTDVDAGYKDIDETPGYVLDSATLGDANYIYKSDSVWEQRRTGGQEVFAWRKLFNVGCIAKQCVVEVQGMHYFLSDSDLYRHNGVSFESVGRPIRYYFRYFSSLSYRPILVHNPGQREIIVLRKDPDVDVTYFNTAMVYNYEYGTWSFRELTNEIMHATDYRFKSSPSSGSLRPREGLVYSTGNINDGLIKEWDVSGSVTCTFNLLIRGAQAPDYHKTAKLQRLTPYISAAGGVPIIYNIARYMNRWTDAAEVTQTTSDTLCANFDVIGRNFTGIIQFIGKETDGGRAKFFGFDAYIDIIGDW